MLKILCVGKIKEPYLTSLIEDYKKRILKYHRLEIVEVKDVGVLSLERDLLMKHITPRDFVVTLEISGQSFSSEDFAWKLDELLMKHSSVVFVIGSSLGLHEDVKARSNLAVSFSLFTFPHGLFRGLLLEQIYRSFKIIHHETYHK